MQGGQIVAMFWSQDSLFGRFALREFASTGRPMNVNVDPSGQQKEQTMVDGDTRNRHQDSVMVTLNM